MASTLSRRSASAAVDVALVLGDGAGFSRAFASAATTSAVESAACGPSLNLARAGLETLPRRPVVVGDDGDGIVELRHLMHARHLQRRRVVERGDRAAEHRRRGDGRDLHARHLHVDAEHRRAVDLAGDIEPLRRRADDAEVLGSLSLTSVGTGSFAAASASSP